MTFPWSAAASAESGAWLASDNGLLGSNFPLPAISTQAALTAGRLYLAKLNIRRACTISNLWLIVESAGSGASTGSFVGLYSQAGAKLTGSADIASGFTSFGAQYALTTPQAVAAGSFVWAAVLSNLASTQPSLATGFESTSNAFATNINLPAAAYNFADNGTSLTALPATITPSSNDQSNALGIWCGYS